MKVSDLMLPGVQTVTPSQAIHEAQTLLKDGEYDELLALLSEDDACIEGMPNGDLVSGELSGVFANEHGLHNARDKAGEP